MTTTKFLNYFNLVVAVVLLWTYLRSLVLLYDYVYIIGLVLTIWYNWWTLKRIMGQKSALDRLNYFVGIATIVFGVLLTTASLAMISEGFQNKRLHLLLGLLYIPLGVTTTVFSWTTLKYHKAP